MPVRQLIEGAIVTGLRDRRQRLVGVVHPYTPPRIGRPLAGQSHDFSDSS